MKILQKSSKITENQPFLELKNVIPIKGPPFVFWTPFWIPRMLILMGILQIWVFKTLFFQNHCFFKKIQRISTIFFFSILDMKKTIDPPLWKFIVFYWILAACIQWWFENVSVLGSTHFSFIVLEPQSEPFFLFWPYSIITFWSKNGIQFLSEFQVEKNTQIRTFLVGHKFDPSRISHPLFSG